jgi:hypothetical protein
MTMSTTVERLRGDALRIKDEEEGWAAIIEPNGMLEVYVRRDGRYQQVGWGRAYRNPGNVEWHSKPPFDAVDLMERAIYGTKVGQERLMQQWYPWWHKAVWG